MSRVPCALAGLSFLLPADFALVVDRQEVIPLPGPPGATALERQRNWRAPDGRTVIAFWWEPRAPRPGGPLVAAEEWPASVAGRAVTIIRTSQFMGLARQVLATHLTLARPAAQVLLYAERVERDEFAALLATVALAETP